VDRVRSYWYRFLKVFTDIRPGEGPTAVLLTLNVYLLFLAYYIIKPVREALILAGKGAEWKSYLSAASAVLLVFAVKAFSRVASRYPRQKLITLVTLFFISNLVLFYFLSLTSVPLGTMGILFFIWVGIFNVMVVAQFWGFANDIYTEEAGKRLFPIVAFGATFGGFSGSAVAGWLVRPIGVYQMMLVAGVILGLCILLTWLIHTREVKAASARLAGEKGQEEKEKPLEEGGGFQLVFKKRYLLAIAFFVLLLNFVNTNGEYILGNVAENAARHAVEAGTSGGLDVKGFIGQFYAGFMRDFNLVAMFIQLFLVSRIFKWFGVRPAVFFLPVLAISGYFIVALGASLLLIRWVKVLENGTDYSLMNTTRHALFLVTSREEKYKAKAAVGTFFHRAGDVLSAVIVFLGTSYLAFSTEGFAVFNVVLVTVWILLGVVIFREHRRLSS